MAPSATTTGIDTRRRGVSAAGGPARSWPREQKVPAWTGAPWPVWPGRPHDGPKPRAAANPVVAWRAPCSAAKVIGSGAVGPSACAGAFAMAGVVTGSAVSTARVIADGGTSTGRPLASQNSRRFCALVVTSGSSAGRVRAAMA